MEAHVGVDRGLDGAGQPLTRDEEHRVNAHTPCLVVGDGIGHLLRGPAVHAWRRGPEILSVWRRVIGDLGLVEVDPAAVAVPDNLVLLEVLDEEAIGGDVVAVHHHAVRGGVDVPAHRSGIAVVGAPEPDVVNQCIVAVDLQTDAGPARGRSSDANEQVVDCDRIGSVVGATPGRADLYQDGRVNLARVDEDMRQFHPVHVGGGDNCIAGGGPQCGIAHPHHDGVGAVNLDGNVEVVDAGREEQVLAGVEGGVHGGGGVHASPSHVELVERDGGAWCLARAPGDAVGVGAKVRNVDLVVHAVEPEERLLARDGCGVDESVGGGGPNSAGQVVGDAHEYHVPDIAGPAAPLRVAGDPLLLGDGSHVEVDDGIGYPPAAHPAKVVVEVQIVATDMHAAEGTRLGDGPLHAGAGRGDREILHPSPEVLGAVEVGQHCV